MKLRHKLLSGVLAAPFVLTASVAAGDAAPPKPVKQVPRMVQHFTNGDQVYLQPEEGTCTLFRHVSCPPNVPCNPPRPVPVECPSPGLVAVLPNGDSIHRRANYFCYQRSPMNCPEGVKCNPPPPRKVDCPAEDPKKVKPKPIERK